MYRKDYIPKSGADFKQWSENLVQELQVSPNLLNPNRQQNLQNSVSVLNSSHQRAAAAEAAYLKALEQLEQDKELHLEVVRDSVNSVKKADDYTPAIGRSLKILSTEVGDKDWDDMKPNPKIKSLANMVQISYTRGKSEGVRVYARRHNEVDFKYLAQNTASPFKDARPNLAGVSSERREYKFVYVKNNAVVGQFSDIVSANVFIQGID